MPNKAPRKRQATYTDAELKEAGFPDVWDNTMRVLARTCSRKLYWFLRGFDYSSKPVYFTWGSAWHEIMASWYTIQKKGVLLGEEELARKCAIETGLRYWDSQGGVDVNDNKRESLRSIGEAFFENYPDDPFKLVTGGAEAGWMWPLQDSPYFYAGSMDGYIEWDDFGLLVHEHKTSGGYLNDAAIRQWNFASQITGSIWYLTQLHGPKAYGCLVQMATKKVPGPRSNWTTPRFARSIEKRTPAQLKEFEEDVLFDLEDFKTKWSRWHFPKTCDHTNCSGGIGKSPCLFSSFCFHSDVHFTEINPLDYTGIAMRTESWEPWNRSGEQT